MFLFEVSYIYQAHIFGRTHQLETFLQFQKRGLQEKTQTVAVCVVSPALQMAPQTSLVRGVKSQISVF